MRAMRFSIAGLMGVVLFAAIGFAALRNPSETWAGIVLLATLGALGVATVGAFCHSAATRGGFLGFAVFGWIYMIAAFHPFFGHWPTLPTQSLIELLAPRIAGIDGPFPAFGGMGGMGGGMRSVSTNRGGGDWGRGCLRSILSNRSLSVRITGRKSWSFRLQQALRRCGGKLR